MSKVGQMVMEINELLDDMSNSIDDVARISGAPRTWVEDIIQERFNDACERSEQQSKLTVDTQEYMM